MTPRSFLLTEQLGADGHDRARVAGTHLLEGDAEPVGQRIGREPGEQRGIDVGIPRGVGHDQRL